MKGGVLPSACRNGRTERSNNTMMPGHSTLAGGTGYVVDLLADPEDATIDRCRQLNCPAYSTLVACKIQAVMR